MNGPVGPDIVGLGIVGLGMASRPHALALGELADKLHVRGAFAPGKASRTAFNKAYGFPVVADVAQLAEDPLIDAILLITPPNARLPLVKRFADAGKHILSEKPLERNDRAAGEIVRICAAAGVQLGVVFQHRFRAASQELEKLLADGAFGEVRVVRADIPWWREQSYYDAPGRGSYERDGGGVLISQAIHTLDLMLSLLGPVVAVQAHCATTAFHRMEAEDFAAGTMQFASGACGALFASTASFPGEAESLSMHCDKASIVLKSGVLAIHWRDGRVETRGAQAGTGGGADPMAFPHDWHRALLADFAAAISSGAAPTVTGHEALAVHHLITALETSSREGRRIAPRQVKPL